QKDFLLLTKKPENLDEQLTQLESGLYSGILITTPDPQKVFQEISSKFTVLVAGGGLILNQEEDFLMIFRRGKWDLPKGKWEEGETLEACALREVTEETGLHSLQLQEKITTTYHVYPHQGIKILKRTVWFKMIFFGKEPTIPQIEEDIIDIQWVKKQHLNGYLRYSYPNIREVFAALAEK
ncbi:MAG: NUDIX hydrolase, partial [Chitinophagaceae bacterium]